MSISSLSAIVRNIINKMNSMSITRQNLNYTRMTYVSNDTKHYATKYMQILGIDTNNMNVTTPTVDENINIYLPSDSAVGHTLFIRHENGGLGEQPQTDPPADPPQPPQPPTDPADPELIKHAIILHYVDSAQQSGYSLLGVIEERFGSSIVYFNGEKWIHILG